MHHKPTHVVVVEDPWFGAYIRLDFSADNCPACVTIGPLTRTVLSYERLHNIGRRYNRGALREKPCIHTYVEGLVTGVTEDVGDQWITRLADSSYEQEHIVQPPGISSRISHHMTVHEEGATVRVELTGYAITSINGGVTWQYPVQVSATMVGDLHRDDLSGREYYDNFRVVACSPNVRAFWEEEIPPEGTGLVGFSQRRLSSNSTGAGIPPDLSPVGVSSPFSGEPTSHYGACLANLHQAIEVALRDMDMLPYSNNDRDHSIFDAVDDLDIEGLNLIESMSDLRDIMALISPLKDLIHTDWTSPLQILRFLAGLHLWWRYIIKTGKMDLESICELFKWLRTHRQEILNALNMIYVVGRGTSTKVSEHEFGTYVDMYTTKVTFLPDTSSFRMWMKTLHLLGFTPSWADLWDLAPFSFVADWFIPIGEAIDNTEDMMVLQQLPLQYLLYSRKIIMQYNRGFVDNGHLFSVDLKLVTYRREASKRLPKDMWMGLKFRDPRKQFLTAGALVIAVFTGGTKKPKYHMH